MFFLARFFNVNVVELLQLQLAGFFHIDLDWSCRPLHSFSVDVVDIIAVVILGSGYSASLLAL